MKRVLSLILALGILFGSVTGAAAPGKIYTQAQKQDTSAAFLASVFLSILNEILPEKPEEPEEPAEEITIAERAVYWGLPADIAWIEDPQSEEDIENNILFAFLHGEYAFRFENLTWEQKEWLFAQIRPESGSSYIKKLACSYPELAGALANVWEGCGRGQNSNNDKYFLFIDFPIWDGTNITTELLYQQQLEALDAALAISKELHENGTIRDGMTQKEIAWVYYKYLRSLHVKVGEGEAAVSTGKTALYDSAWACLVSKKADCVGRAAGFNLLMHIEGISAQGVRGRFLYVSSGHVLSRVILDGEEYFCDWGNDKGIWPEEDFAAKFNFAFDDDSLAYARAHGGDYKA